MLNPKVKVDQKLLESYTTSLPDCLHHRVTKATIVAFDGQDAVLDVQGKSHGILACKDISKKELRIGQEVRVYVIEEENARGEIVLSAKVAQALQAWKQVQNSLENGTSFEVEVMREIKGGLVVMTGTIELFLPSSQIDTMRVETAADFLGKKLEVVTLKINEKKRNALVSRRLILEKAQKEQRDALLSDLQAGQIVRGTVVNITRWGVYVKLAGEGNNRVVGMVHLSDQTHSKRPLLPNQAKGIDGNPLFEVGKSVEVVVKEIDTDKGQIALSTKLLMPNPWKELDQRLKVGQLISGKVVEIADYGLLVEVEKGLVGLLHISDLSLYLHIDDPREVANVGQTVKVKVSKIDPENQSLRLSIKEIEAAAWDEVTFSITHAPGSRHQAKVQKVVTKGAYLQLATSVVVFLPNKYLFWKKQVNDARDHLKIGSSLEITIASLDKEEKRIIADRRKPEENPWPALEQKLSPGSLHPGTILSIVNEGAIVVLPCEIEVFVPKKELIKEDKKPYQLEETLNFVVLKLVPKTATILLSHTLTYQKEKLARRFKEEAIVKNKEQHKDLEPDKPSTLNDLTALRALREELAKAEN